jgi:O-acetyl-ADP-ribose deacetylase (regulator of RNase III)
VKKLNLNGKDLVLTVGDITEQKVDAIVNAANSSLMGGGGVDGAIHRAGGPKIIEECKAYVAAHGRLPTGEAMITTGGNLPARHVIHTVGPIYSEKADSRKPCLPAGRQTAELRNCYINSLKLAAEKGLKTIAFPSISTGAYRYPLAEAAPIALKAVKDFLKENSSIKEVRFVLFNNETYEAYAKLPSSAGS